MQNGTRKEQDSRYTSVYSSKPSNPLKGKQLSPEATRTPPADRKAEYPKEYGSKKK
jgi:hypothetical protein